MRIGHNPNKDKKISESNYFHQIVLPVYIPNDKEYFRDSFKILKLCIASLLKTTHSKTFITIVNNGSCEEVRSFLNSLYNEEKIQEVIHTSNIGKINAILKGMVGHDFPLVTISDADVLFLNKWQEATYDIYNAFPKAAVVSPVPVFRKQMEYTQPIHFDYFLSKKIKFKTVKNPEAMTLYAKSIGWPYLDKKWKDVIMTLTENDITAVVGAPHFVATYKSELFDNLPSKFAENYLGNRMEQHFFDKSVQFFSAYRLSTNDNYAYHMGNVLEDWMEEKLGLLNQNKHSVKNVGFKKLLKPRINFLLKTKIINAVFSSRYFKNAYYKSKGLPNGKKI